MLNRVLDWFMKRRRWTADHKREWLGFTEPDASGVTPLQKMVLSHLEIAAPDLEFVREGISEAYFIATIPDSKINVFVLSDGVQIIKNRHLLRAEEWDYRTPAEMIEELDLVVRTCRHAT